MASPQGCTTNNMKVYYSYPIAIASEEFLSVTKLSTTVLKAGSIIYVDNTIL